MRLDVDFGGAKIEGALLDSNGEIHPRQRVPNPGNCSPAVRAVADQTTRIEPETGQRAGAVGVAMLSSLSPVTGMVGNSRPTWLNGMPFLEVLQCALARPVRVENDANCLALCEARGRRGGRRARRVWRHLRRGVQRRRCCRSQKHRGRERHWRRMPGVVIDIIDPDGIVFGGGVSNVDCLYPSVRGRVIGRVFSDMVKTKVAKNKHGDGCGVHGGAWLFTPEEAARQ